MALSIHVTRQGSITTIHIDRATQKNALSLRCWDELAAAVQSCNTDVNCRLVLFRGVNGHFGAGADISEFETAFADENAILSYFERMERALSIVESVDKPTIAVVEGYCFGASLALALACDIRFARTTSVLAITAAKLGISYPYGDVRRVVRAIGSGRAKSLLFTGRRVRGDEAFSIGLLDHIEEDDRFEAALEAFSATIVSASGHSIRASKNAVRAANDGLDDQNAGYPQALIDAIRSEDFVEGMKAYTERRQPAFST